MAQGPSDTILVAIRITLRTRESKVRNPDPPDRRRFVLSEYFLLIINHVATQSIHPVERRAGVGTGLSPSPSVGLSVCMSVCLVGELWKPLVKSRCRLGLWVWSVEGWVN